jgi:hypothetical protein
LQSPYARTGGTKLADKCGNFTDNRRTVFSSTWAGWICHPISNDIDNGRADNRAVT